MFTNETEKTLITFELERVQLVVLFFQVKRSKPNSEFQWNPLSHMQ